MASITNAFNNVFELPNQFVSIVQKEQSKFLEGIGKAFDPDTYSAKQSVDAKTTNPRPISPGRLEQLKAELKSTDKRAEIREMHEELWRMVGEAETSGRVIINDNTPKRNSKQSGRRWSSYSGNPKDQRALEGLKMTVLNVGCELKM
eukprot:CAMPEP_0181323390 /NCGR_PEP_ID=MMETSP1101-20121128/19759_1 /TAXON_ID=46948 /ORGANISM="Rhodomonas abbreviata, Strain Caron Lab Isolate" /LENGTH=146 /DNA_ID=CAMNT_0023431413 /DNA_START=89 /DNA_END=529 /DNA_ORIENTATION=+